ncbi:MAG: hypothetical protein GC131_04470 [Alphaproteobacteria bacterium]|nr:hypothetical protein [Alphaproteobacteria bacterium]
MLCFSDLETRYGEVTALAMLMDMERHVGLRSCDLAELDPEARLQTALALMERHGGNTVAAGISAFAANGACTRMQAA